MRWVLSLLALGLGFSACSPATSPNAQSVPVTGPEIPSMAHYDRYWSGFIQRWRVPAAAIAVMKDGRLVFAKGYGYADVAASEPVQPDALFRIASLSKPITAAMVLRLVQEGKLNLETKVLDLLPDIKPLGGKLADPRWQQISVRMLLQHSAGFDRELSFDPMFRSAQIASASGVPSPPGPDTILRYMLSRPLDFDPGSRRAYSNFGYSVLGRIIERVSGQSYAEYTRGVLARWGVSRMELGRSLLEQRLSGEVRYYERPSEQWMTSVFAGMSQPVLHVYGGWHQEGLDAHGGWVASSVDLLRFVRAVFGPGEPRLLDAAMIKEMAARPSIPGSQGAVYYGLGWDVRPVGDSANFWHDGGLPGTRTLLVQTYNGMAWAVLFNTRLSVQEDQAMYVEAEQAMWRLASQVSVWPDRDLFDVYR